MEGGNHRKHVTDAPNLGATLPARPSALRPSRRAAEPDTSLARTIKSRTLSTALGPVKGTQDATLGAAQSLDKRTATSTARAIPKVKQTSERELTEEVHKRDAALKQLTHSINTIKMRDAEKTERRKAEQREVEASRGAERRMIELEGGNPDAVFGILDIVEATRAWQENLQDRVLKREQEIIARVRKEFEKAAKAKKQQEEKEQELTRYMRRAGPSVLENPHRSTYPFETQLELETLQTNIHNFPTTHLASAAIRATIDRAEQARVAAHDSVTSAVLHGTSTERPSPRDLPTTCNFAAQNFVANALDLATSNHNQATPQISSSGDYLSDEAQAALRKEADRLKSIYGPKNAHDAAERAEKLKAVVNERNKALFAGAYFQPPSASGSSQQGGQSPPPFTFDPPVAEFLNYSPGAVYELELKAVNVSNRSNALRPLPIPSEYADIFQIRMVPAGRLGAGVSTKFKLIFTPHAITEADVADAARIANLVHSGLNYKSTSDVTDPESSITSKLVDQLAGLRVPLRDMDCELPFLAEHGGVFYLRVKIRAKRAEMSVRLLSTVSEHRDTPTQMSATSSSIPFSNTKPMAEKKDESDLLFPPEQSVGTAQLKLANPQQYYIERLVPQALRSFVPRIAYFDLTVGRCVMGESSVTTLEFTNQGAIPIKLTCTIANEGEADVDSPSPEYLGSGGKSALTPFKVPRHLVVEPGSKCHLPIEFHPQTEGTHASTLHISASFVRPHGSSLASTISGSHESSQGGDRFDSYTKSLVPRVEPGADILQPELDLPEAFYWTTPNTFELDLLGEATSPPLSLSHSTLNFEMCGTGSVYRQFFRIFNASTTAARVTASVPTTLQDCLTVNPSVAFVRAGTYAEVGVTFAPTSALRAVIRQHSTRRSRPDAVIPPALLNAIPLDVDPQDYFKFDLTLSSPEIQTLPMKLTLTGFICDGEISLALADPRYTLAGRQSGVALAADQPKISARANATLSQGAPMWSQDDSKMLGIQFGDIPLGQTASVAVIVSNPSPLYHELVVEVPPLSRTSAAVISASTNGLTLPLPVPANINAALTRAEVNKDSDVKRDLLDMISLCQAVSGAVISLRPHTWAVVHIAASPLQGDRPFEVPIRFMREDGTSATVLCAGRGVDIFPSQLGLSMRILPAVKPTIPYLSQHDQEDDSSLHRRDSAAFSSSVRLPAIADGDSVTFPIELRNCNPDVSLAFKLGLLEEMIGQVSEECVTTSVETDKVAALPKVLSRTVTYLKTNSDEEYQGKCLRSHIDLESGDSNSPSSSVRSESTFSTSRLSPSSSRLSFFGRRARDSTARSSRVKRSHQEIESWRNKSLVTSARDVVRRLCVPCFVQDMTEQAQLTSSQHRSQSQKPGQAQCTSRTDGVMAQTSAANEFVDRGLRVNIEAAQTTDVKHPVLDSPVNLARPTSRLNDAVETLHPGDWLGSSFDAETDEGIVPISELSRTAQQRLLAPFLTFSPSEGIISPGQTVRVECTFSPILFARGRFGLTHPESNQASGRHLLARDRHADRNSWPSWPISLPPSQYHFASMTGSESQSTWFRIATHAVKCSIRTISPAVTSATHPSSGFAMTIHNKAEKTAQAVLTITTTTVTPPVFVVPRALNFGTHAISSRIPVRRTIQLRNMSQNHVRFLFSLKLIRKVGDRTHVEIVSAPKWQDRQHTRYRSPVISYGFYVDSPVVSLGPGEQCSLTIIFDPSKAHHKRVAPATKGADTESHEGTCLPFLHGVISSSLGQPAESSGLSEEDDGEVSDPRKLDALLIHTFFASGTQADGHNPQVAPALVTTSVSLAATLVRPSISVAVGNVPRPVTLAIQQQRPLRQQQHYQFAVLQTAVSALGDVLKTSGYGKSLRYGLAGFLNTILKLRSKLSSPINRLPRVALASLSSHDESHALEKKSASLFEMLLAESQFAAESSPLAVTHQRKTSTVSGRKSVSYTRLQNSSVDGVQSPTDVTEAPASFSTLLVQFASNELKALGLPLDEVGPANAAAISRIMAVVLQLTLPVATSLISRLGITSGSDVSEVTPDDFAAVSDGLLTSLPELWNAISEAVALRYRSPLAVSLGLEACANQDLPVAGDGASGSNHLSIPLSDFALDSLPANNIRALTTSYFPRISACMTELGYVIDADSSSTLTTVSDGFPTQKIVADDTLSQQLALFNDSRLESIAGQLGSEAYAKLVERSVASVLCMSIAQGVALRLTKELDALARRRTRISRYIASLPRWTIPGTDIQIGTTDGSHSQGIRYDAYAASSPPLVVFLGDVLVGTQANVPVLIRNASPKLTMRFSAKALAFVSGPNHDMIEDPQYAALRQAAGSSVKTLANIHPLHAAIKINPSKTVIPPLSTSVIWCSFEPLSPGPYLRVLEVGGVTVVVHGRAHDMSAGLGAASLLTLPHSPCRTAKKDIEGQVVAGRLDAAIVDINLSPGLVAPTILQASRARALNAAVRRAERALMEERRMESGSPKLGLSEYAVLNHRANAKSPGSLSHSSTRSRPKQSASSRSSDVFTRIIRKLTIKAYHEMRTGNHKGLLSARGLGLGRLAACVKDLLESQKSEVGKLKQQRDKVLQYAHRVVKQYQALAQETVQLQPLESLSPSPRIGAAQSRPSSGVHRHGPSSSASAGISHAVVTSPPSSPRSTAQSVVHRESSHATPQIESTGPRLSPPAVTVVAATQERRSPSPLDELGDAPEELPKDATFGSLPGILFEGVYPVDARISRADIGSVDRSRAVKDQAIGQTLTHEESIHRLVDDMERKYPNALVTTGSHDECEGLTLQNVFGAYSHHINYQERSVATRLLSLSQIQEMAPGAQDSQGSEIPLHTKRDYVDSVSEDLGLELDQCDVADGLVPRYTDDTITSDTDNECSADEAEEVAGYDNHGQSRPEPKRLISIGFASADPAKVEQMLTREQEADEDYAFLLPDALSHRVSLSSRKGSLREDDSSSESPDSDSDESDSDVALAKQVLLSARPVDMMASGFESDRSSTSVDEADIDAILSEGEDEENSSAPKRALKGEVRAAIDEPDVNPSCSLDLDAAFKPACKNPLASWLGHDASLEAVAERRGLKTAKVATTLLPSVSYVVARTCTESWTPGDSELESLFGLPAKVNVVGGASSTQDSEVSTQDPFMLPLNLSPTTPRPKTSGDRALRVSDTVISSSADASNSNWFGPGLANDVSDMRQETLMQLTDPYQVCSSTSNLETSSPEQDQQVPTTIVDLLGCGAKARQRSVCASSIYLLRNSDIGGKSNEPEPSDALLQEKLEAEQATARAVATARTLVPDSGLAVVVAAAGEELLAGKSLETEPAPGVDPEDTESRKEIQRHLYKSNLGTLASLLPGHMMSKIFKSEVGKVATSLVPSAFSTLANTVTVEPQSQQNDPVQLVPGLNQVPAVLAQLIVALSSPGAQQPQHNSLGQSNTAVSAGSSLSSGAPGTATPTNASQRGDAFLKGHLAENHAELGLRSALARAVRSLPHYACRKTQLPSTADADTLLEVLLKPVVPALTCCMLVCLLLNRVPVGTGGESSDTKDEVADADIDVQKLLASSRSMAHFTLELLKYLRPFMPPCVADLCKQLLSRHEHIFEAAAAVDKAEAAALAASVAYESLVNDLSNAGANTTGEATPTPPRNSTGTSTGRQQPLNERRGLMGSFSQQQSNQQSDRSAPNNVQTVNLAEAKQNAYVAMTTAQAAAVAAASSVETANPALLALCEFLARAIDALALSMATDTPFADLPLPSLVALLAALYMAKPPTLTSPAAEFVARNRQPLDQKWRAPQVYMQQIILAAPGTLSQVGEAARLEEEVSQAFGSLGIQQDPPLVAWNALSALCANHQAMVASKRPSTWSLLDTTEVEEALRRIGVHFEAKRTLVEPAAQSVTSLMATTTAVCNESWQHNTSAHGPRLAQALEHIATTSSPTTSTLSPGSAKTPSPQQLLSDLEYAERSVAKLRSNALARLRAINRLSNYDQFSQLTKSSEIANLDFHPDVVKHLLADLRAIERSVSSCLTEIAACRAYIAAKQQNALIPLDSRSQSIAQCKTHLKPVDIAVLRAQIRSQLQYVQNQAQNSVEAVNRARLSNADPMAYMALLDAEMSSANVQAARALLLAYGVEHPQSETLVPMSHPPLAVSLSVPPSSPIRGNPNQPRSSLNTPTSAGSATATTAMSGSNQSQTAPSQVSALPSQVQIKGRVPGQSKLSVKAAAALGGDAMSLTPVNVSAPAPAGVFFEFTTASGLPVSSVLRGRNEQQLTADMRTRFGNSFTKGERGAIRTPSATKAGPDVAGPSEESDQWVSGLASVEPHVTELIPAAAAWESAEATSLLAAFAHLSIEPANGYLLSGTSQAVTIIFDIDEYQTKTNAHHNDHVAMTQDLMKAAEKLVNFGIRLRTSPRPLLPVSIVRAAEAAYINAEAHITTLLHAPTATPLLAKAAAYARTLLMSRQIHQLESLTAQPATADVLFTFGEANDAAGQNEDVAGAQSTVTSSIATIHVPHPSAVVGGDASGIAGHVTDSEHNLTPEQILQAIATDPTYIELEQHLTFARRAAAVLEAAIYHAPNVTHFTVATQL